jgi:hypothetical protein
MSPCLSPGAAPDLPARCVNVIEQYLSTLERGKGRGTLFERPHARRDQRIQAEMWPRTAHEATNRSSDCFVIRDWLAEPRGVCELRLTPWQLSRWLCAEALCAFPRVVGEAAVDVDFTGGFRDQKHSDAVLFAAGERAGEQCEALGCETVHEGVPP